MNKRIHYYKFLILIMIFLSCFDSSGSNELTNYKDNTVILSIDNSNTAELTFGPSNGTFFFLVPVIGSDFYLVAYSETPICSPYSLSSPDNEYTIQFPSQPAAGSIFKTTSSQNLLDSIRINGISYKEDNVTITISNIDNKNNQLQGTLTGYVKDFSDLSHSINVTFSVYIVNINIFEFEMLCN